jgi:hypothetical protein
LVPEKLVARSAGTLDAAPTTANPMFRLICFLSSVHFGTDTVLHNRALVLSARLDLASAKDL